MKRTAVSLLALLAASCGIAAPVSPPVARVTPTLASQSPPVPPTPAPKETSCRLPIWLYDNSTHTGTGYFLQVQGTELVPAQPSVTLPSIYASYLRAADRWVSAPRSLVAPDGKHYAYNEGSGNPEVDRVHVVDVATGQDRVITQGNSDTGYRAIAFEDDGLYAGRPNSRGPGTPPGLWRLDPETGAATVIDARSWHWISNGYAYAVVPNASDPVVVQGGPEADTLLRLDIRTQTVQQWFRKRGVFLDVRGFDWKGRPLLTPGGTLADLVVISGQNDVHAIAGGSRDVTFRFGGHASFVQASLVADPDGFWFVADQGVYRYAEQSRFLLRWTNRSAGSVEPVIAGACA